MSPLIFCYSIKIKDALSGQRQFLATGNPLKMLKKLKSSFGSQDI